MHRYALIAALALTPLASPAFAANKKKDCGYQAQVVEAIRQARIAKVRERKVEAHIAAQKPDWPEGYNAAIPLIKPWVYEMKMKDVVEKDVAGAWKEMCLKR